MDTEPVRPWKKYVLGGAVLVAAIFVFDWTRWWVFETRIYNHINAPWANPTARQIIGLKPAFVEEARSLWISPGSLEIAMHLEQHSSNGYAGKEDMLECYWFLVIKARHGRHEGTWEQRIDNKVAETDTEALEAAGVAVLKKKAQSGG